MLVRQGVVAVLVGGGSLDDFLGPLVRFRLDQLEEVTLETGPAVIGTPDPAERAGDLLEDVQVLDLVLKQWVGRSGGIRVLEQVGVAVGQRQRPVVRVGVDQRVRAAPDRRVGALVVAVRLAVHGIGVDPLAFQAEVQVQVDVQQAAVRNVVRQHRDLEGAGAFTLAVCRRAIDLVAHEAIVVRGIEHNSGRPVLQRDRERIPGGVRDANCRFGIETAELSVTAHRVPVVHVQRVAAHGDIGPGDGHGQRDVLFIRNLVHHVVVGLAGIAGVELVGHPVLHIGREQQPELVALLADAGAGAANTRGAIRRWDAIVVAVGGEAGQPVKVTTHTHTLDRIAVGIERRQ